MCGIVGFTGEPDAALLERMNASQHHRGPDEGGAYVCAQAGVSLAARRLAIQDLADGHQPMRLDTPELCVVFNGEIYNAPELRRDLEKQGAAFRTSHSDTEVLLHLYARHGADLVQRLNGMFAFVIHDRARGRLVGARDRLGIKPLYYTLAGGRLAFASELKSLRTLPWVPTDVDRGSLFHYLSFQYVPGPDTILAGVRKLGPGHRFEYRLADGALAVERWWAPHFAGAGADAADPAVLRERVADAVRRWSLSDVPVASSLSGGFDSAVVTALLARDARAPVKTFTLGFDDAPELDERAQARVVAEHYGTEHHEIVLGVDQLLDDLDAMVHALDEPYGGGLPSWYVFREMGREVKVAMTGSGGDELFGSYGKWRPFESPWALARRVARRLGEGSSPAHLLRHRVGARYPLYWQDDVKRRHLLQPDWARGCTASEALIEALWDACPSPSPRDRIPFVDLQTQLPEEFLHMTDRFSMAHSLEARTPLLDHELVEAVLAIPARRRTSPGRLKALFHDALGDLVPAEVHARPKRGFVLPLGAWLRTRLRDRVETLLSPEALRAQGIFRPSVWDRWVAPHLAGRRDHAQQVWTLLMFQLWHGRHAS